MPHRARLKLGPAACICVSIIKGIMSSKCSTFLFNDLGEFTDVVVFNDAVSVYSPITNVLIDLAALLKCKITQKSEILF